jgi:hypothetical protein
LDNTAYTQFDKFSLTAGYTPAIFFGGPRRVKAAKALFRV